MKASFKHKLQIYRYWIILIGVIILIKILSFWGLFTNVIYPEYIYVALQSFWQCLAFLPFSVGDVLYFFLIFMMLYKLFKSFRDNVYKKQQLLKTLPLMLSILWFYFHANWAFLYYKEPLSDLLKFEKPMNTSNLKNLTNLLIDKTNQIHFEITQDKNSQIAWEDPDEISEGLISSYQLTYNTNHQLLKPKASMWSWLLSYMGFAGYLNPFTLEAQYNYLTPTYSQVFTKSHEMAHQLGYARENETNYVAFLNCINHDDKKIVYAGYLAATRYALSALKDIQEGSELKYLNQLSAGIHLDLEESKQFRERYHGPLDDLMHWWYDQFLKINNQEDGIESYQGILFYLVNHYKL